MADQRHIAAAPSAGEKYRREAGFTLTELMVTMLVLGIALPLVTGALLTLITHTRALQARGAATAQARLAVAEIDRQVRSGNVIYDPATETLPNSVRVFTQADGLRRCMQWQVTGGKLRTRTYSPTWQTDSSVSAWQTVATNIVNGAGTPPFRLDYNPTYNSRLLVVRLLTQASGGGAPVEVTTEVNGRNSTFGGSTSVCATAPSP